MLSKYFPCHICLFFLVLTGMLPNRGHTQPQAVPVNDPATAGFMSYESIEHKDLLGFKTGYLEAGLRRHQFNLVARQFTIGSEAYAESILLNEKASYSVGEDVYAFSALHYDSPGFNTYYRSSITAGIGRHILNGGNYRLDLDLGAGSSSTGLFGSPAANADSVVRVGLTYTGQPTAGSRLRQDLVIESSRSHTSTESMTTWSYEMHPKLALELLFAVRKSSNPRADLLDVQRRALFSLNYAF